MRKVLSTGFPAGKPVGISIVLAVLSLGSAIFFILQIYDTYRQDQNSENTYEQMAQYVLCPEENHLSVIPEVDAALEEDTRILEIDFAALKEASPDLVGWLYCPDTVISYPVVQGEDNVYYLNHLADRSENRGGSLFMDYQNQKDFGDENTLIYGHHMASGKMFASLVLYGDQAYYEAHPVIYLITEEEEYRLELFAGYTVTVDSEAYTLRFGSKESFAIWLEQTREFSDFRSETEVNENDNIVTLSTCAYSFQNARYVVHGKLIKLN